MSAERQGWPWHLELSLHGRAGCDRDRSSVTSASGLQHQGVTATLPLAPGDAVQECGCWSRSLGELGTLHPHRVEASRLSKSLCWALPSLLGPGLCRTAEVQRCPRLSLSVPASKGSSLEAESWQQIRSWVMSCKGKTPKGVRGGGRVSWRGADDTLTEQGSASTAWGAHRSLVWGEQGPPELWRVSSLPLTFWATLAELFPPRNCLSREQGWEGPGGGSASPGCQQPAAELGARPASGQLFLPGGCSSPALPGL